jgi:hypothetical protein
MNYLSPNQMTTEERLSELATILSVGLIRLNDRKSRELNARTGDGCLHFLADQCRHETVEIETEKTS